MKAKKTIFPELEILQQHPSAVLSFVPDSPWQTDDRKWFARHSGRGYRLRRTFNGEDPTECPYMLVRRVRDGVRAKLGLSSAGAVVAADMALLLGASALAETALAMLWEAIDTGDLVPVDELLARARALHSSTRH